MDGYTLAYCCWSFNLIVWPSRRGGLINESTFFPESLLVPRLPPSVLSNRLSFFSRLCSQTHFASIRSTSSLLLYVSVCMCASAVMCSQVRPLKLTKNPTGEMRPRCRVAGGSTIETSRRGQTAMSLSHVLCRTFSLVLAFFPLFALTVSVSLQNLHLQLLPQVSHPPLQGERCSFSVQMWFYFLCGLRSDLWAVLPADLAKEMLGQVLSETLQQLVQRYSSVRPSYRRQLQVRCYSCVSKLDLFQLFFFSIVARSPFFFIVVTLFTGCNS